MKRARKYCIQCALIFFCLCTFIGSLHASEMMENPLTPPDTSSPQATLRSYIDNMTTCYHILQKAFLLDVQSDNWFTHTPEVKKLSQEATLHFQKAIDCLDFSNVPAAYRDEYSKEVVIQLKEVLDRVNLPVLSTVPSMSSVKDDIKYWRVPKTPIELVLIEEGVRSGEFLFSAETVSTVPELYEMAQTLPYKTLETQNFFKFYISTPGSLLPPKWFHYLPSWMSSEIYYSETIFQWGMLILSFIFLIVFTSFVYRFCSKHMDTEKRPLRSDLFKLTLPVLLTGTAYFLMYFLEEVVNLSGQTLHYTTGALDVIKWLAAAWAVVVSGSLCATILISSPNVNPKSIDASLIRTVAYLASIFFAICVLFYGGSNLGLPLIPVVTGFGVIGLAVSLAAKPTIENIIGGLTLFADRPVRIGEYCAFDDQWGKVLHIGLRSTRIRAGDRTIISIPNAIFSQMKLVNINRRDIYRFSERIPLRRETTGLQLRWILAKIREMLVAHPKVLSKFLYRVKFDAITEYSKTIRVYTFLDGNLRWEEFLEVRQDLLFRIVNIIESAGTNIAYPSQTLYLKKDTADIAPSSEVLDDMTNKTEYPYPATTEDRYYDLVDRMQYPPEAEHDFEALRLNPKTESNEKEKPKDSMDVDEADAAKTNNYAVYRR